MSLHHRVDHGSHRGVLLVHVVRGREGQGERDVGRRAGGQLQPCAGVSCRRQLHPDADYERGYDSRDRDESKG